MTKHYISSYASLRFGNVARFAGWIGTAVMATWLLTGTAFSAAGDGVWKGNWTPEGTCREPWVREMTALVGPDGIDAQIVNRGRANGSFRADIETDGRFSARGIGSNEYVVHIQGKIADGAVNGDWIGYRGCWGKFVLRMTQETVRRMPAAPSAAAPEQSPPAAGNAIVDRLATLNDLRQSGLISDAEYRTLLDAPQRPRVAAESNAYIAPANGNATRVTGATAQPPTAAKAVPVASTSVRSVLRPARTFHDTVYGFSLSYPGDWVESPTDAAGARMEIEPQGGSITACVIHVEQSGKLRRFSQAELNSRVPQIATEAHWQDSFSSFKNVKLIRIGQRQVGSLPAAAGLVAFNAGDPDSVRRIASLTHVVLRPSGVWTLACTTPVEDFNSVRQTFAAIVDSVRFDG